MLFLLLSFFLQKLICGRNPVWAQSYMGAIPCGCNSRMGAIPTLPKFSYIDSIFFSLCNDIIFGRYCSFGPPYIFMPELIPDSV